MCRSSYRHFIVQKMLIEKHYECFRCEFQRRMLRCTGGIVPAEGCDQYRVRIEITPEGLPRVRVVRPKVEPLAAIQMYPDGTLCLYYPPDDPWRPGDNIHEKIIPWTAEWLVYYELFLIHGKWLGPEAPHDVGPASPRRPRS